MRLVRLTTCYCSLILAVVMMRFQRSMSFRNMSVKRARGRVLQQLEHASAHGFDDVVRGADRQENTLPQGHLIVLDASFLHGRQFGGAGITRRTCDGQRVELAALVLWKAHGHTGKVEVQLPAHEVGRGVRPIFVAHMHGLHTCQRLEQLTGHMVGVPNAGGAEVQRA